MDNLELVEVQFNEEQKAAMARALMAVAEEITSKPKLPPLKHGDVVELVSDSDSDSDCVFLDMLDQNKSECKNEQLQLVPFVMNEQIKEEVKVETVAVNEALNNTAASNVGSGGHFNAINHEEYTISHLTADEQNVQELSSNNTDILKMRTKTPPAIFAIKKVETLEAVGETNYITTPVITEPAIAAAAKTDCDVLGDVVTLASTLGSDKMEWSLEDMDDEFSSEFIIESNISDENDVSNADADETDSVYKDDEEFRDPDYQPETEFVEVDMGDNITLSDSSDDEAASRNYVSHMRKVVEKLIHYYCPECGKDCGELHAWKQHTDIEHQFSSIAKLNLQTIIDREGELCYQCKLCQKKFQTSSRFSVLLNHHITVHTSFPEYMKCRLCDKKMKSRVLLLRHIRLIHKKMYGKGKTRNYHQHIAMHCPICNEILPDYQQWRKHLDDVHQYFKQLLNSVRPVRGNILACNKCDKQFVNYSKVRHLLIHEKYRGFHCKLCTEYSSSNLSRCNAHIRKIHKQTGATLYRCMYCDEVFKTSVSRHRHLMESHSFESPRCQVCGMEFMSIALLITHMNLKSHHKLK